MLVLLSSEKALLYYIVLSSAEYEQLAENKIYFFLLGGESFTHIKPVLKYTKHLIFTVDKKILVIATEFTLFQ